MGEILKRWEWFKAARASDLSDGAKVVLSAINEFVNEASGKAWPSVATLMIATGKSESAVHRANREAREKGWIVTTERPGTTSLNKIALPEGVSILAPLPDEGGVNIDRGRGADTGTPGVSILAPEPSLEPSTLNHSEGESDAEEASTKPVAAARAIFDTASLWGEFWPKDVSKVTAINREAPDRWIRGRLDDVALDLLGWRSRTTAENPAWAEINRRLKTMDFAALICRYRSDALTTADIAEALAAEKILPPSNDPAVSKEGGYAQAS